MKKSRFDEMTQREGLDYLKTKDLIWLPVGPVEVHGKHLPLGCDYLVAEAFALKLAQATDSVYLAPITFAFCGATETLKPTLGISLEVEEDFLKGVVLSLLNVGFRRIIFVSTHGPGTIGLSHIARWAFRELKHPVTYIRPYSAMPKDKVREQFGDLDGAALEATLLLGALEVLGRSHLVDPTTWDNEVELPDGPPALEQFIAKGGYAGLGYEDSRQHVASRAGLSPAKGVKIIDMLVNIMKGAADDLEAYIKHLQSCGLGWKG